MKKQHFEVQTDGFHGTWFPNPKGSDRGLILMLGDSSDDYMARCGAWWLQNLGCHVMGMSPTEKEYGHHNYPLERLESAIACMKHLGCRKIGVVGASTTGMLALVAASYLPDISLTIALSPSDFVMEGFVRDGKDGARERPADGESSLSYHGQGLPYLPYAYRHPEYWQKVMEEAKAGGDRVASRKLFDASELRHPLREEEKIKIERAWGKVICIGAEDDVLWDTCRYIRRMEERLNHVPHTCQFEGWLYEHGTHFVFPESMLTRMLPIGSGLLVSLMFRAGKLYPGECKKTRIDIDRRLRSALQAWQDG